MERRRGAICRCWTLFSPCCAARRPLWWCRAATATTAVATEPARPLRSVAEILALPVDELDKWRPAVIEGVVTFAANRQQFLVVEDASGALYVSSPATAKRLEAGPLPPIEPGSVVEIEGEVVPGGYAPTLFPLGIRVTGRRPVPPARPADLGRLFRGGDTGRRVIVEGVVQEARPDEFSGAWLTLDTAVGILPPLLRLPTRPQAGSRRVGVRLALLPLRLCYFT